MYFVSLSLNHVRRLAAASTLTASLLTGCGSGFDSDDQGPGPIDVSCDALGDWDPQWAAFEDQVLELCNEARAQGHNCGAEGNFGAAPALTMDPRLRCAARAHSAYMAENGEFDHVQQQNGSDPFERIEATGYQFSAAGENIALGQRTPEDVVAGWLESDGHCANIMSPEFTELGVGYAVGSGAPIGANEAPYWTQTFGRPR